MTRSFLTRTRWMMWRTVAPMITAPAMRWMMPRTWPAPPRPKACSQPDSGNLRAKPVMTRAMKLTITRPWVIRNFLFMRGRTSPVPWWGLWRRSLASQSRPLWNSMKPMVMGIRA